MVITLDSHLEGFTVESHMEMRRIPRWPRFPWLRWIKKDDFYAVIDKYHLTGVSFDGYPGKRDVVLTPSRKP